MKKKIFNRPGFFLVITYVLILIALLFIGLLIKSEIQYYYCVTIIWVTIMAILIPLTLYRTLFTILPDQYVKAKVISKNISERPANEGSTTDQYITFEYPDGHSKTFGVGAKAFNSVAMGEEGTLVYREHGKQCFFVRFERESPLSK